MATRDEASATDAAKPPIIIKKYANRRLYNTATSSYVTLDHLCQMVKDGADFVVYDAKSGDDITRTVLTHIIVEEESKGETMLPISFLRQLISLYGDSMQWMVPRYLEYSMQVFVRNQEKMREYVQQAMDGMFPFSSLEEMSRHNIAIFESAIRMFSPFSREGRQGLRPEGLPAGPEDGHQSLDDLRDKIEELKRQIEAMRTTTS